jgi:hypothetical protein
LNATVTQLEMAPWNPHQIEVGVRTVTLNFLKALLLKLYSKAIEYTIPELERIRECFVFVLPRGNFDTPAQPL